MTLVEFMKTIEIMCNALPAHGLEKRVKALYEFHQNTSQEILEKSARKAARELEKFPTPRTFGEIVDIFRPKPEFAWQHWRQKPRLSDDEFCTEMLKQGDPAKTFKGILAICGGYDSKALRARIEPVKRIAGFCAEFLGEPRCAQIAAEFQKTSNQIFENLEISKTQRDPGMEG